MADDRFFSAGADRSWTDAISNQILLQGLDGSAYLRWVGERGTRIEPIVPQFLHEITHHWCFDSRVGRAVALLRLRAGMRATFDAERADKQSLAVDVAKYEAVTTLLKPLAEGLALFSEFDTQTGHMNIVSQPLLALQMCFGFPLEHAQGVELGLLALLQNTRLRRDFASSRKAALYFRRFDCEDAYLPGYLAVKTLQARLRVVAPEFEDPDLFLCYLRSFVFEDAVLADILLRTDQDEIQAARAVAKRIHDRVAELEHYCLGLEEQPSLRALVQRYDAATSVGRADEALAAPILLSEEEIEGAEGSLDQAVTDLMDSAKDAGETAGVVVGAIVANLELRRYAEVARVPVTAGMSDSGERVLRDADGETIYTIPDDIALEDGAAGNVVAVIPSPATFVALVFERENETVLVDWFGSGRAENEASVIRFVTVQSLTENIFRVLSDALDEAVQESWLVVVRDKIRRESLRMATDLYLAVATLNVTDTALPAVRDALLTKGFRPFVDDDPDVARTLAMVGLVNGFSQDETTIRMFGTSLLGIADDDMRLALQTLVTNRHFPLVLSREGSMYALA